MWLAFQQSPCVAHGFSDISGVLTAPELVLTYMASLRLWFQYKAVLQHKAALQQAHATLCKAIGKVLADSILPMFDGAVWKWPSTFPAVLQLGGKGSFW